MDDKTASVVFISFCIGLAVSTAIDVLWLFPDARRKVEREAIAAGVAEYRVADKETGATEFRFIPCDGGKQ